MLHILQLLDQTHVLAHTFVILDKVFFEIHNVLVRGLLGPVDVDMAKILIVGGLDEGERREIGGVCLNGQGLAHF